jgi:glycosyltransferase involved in cell wall biosynthesis
MSRRHLSVHLVPWMVAGVQTQFVHLRRELAQADVELAVTEVKPWLEGGRIERLPLPSNARGTMRSLTTLGRAFRTPSQVVWSQVGLPLLPYLFTNRWLRRVPVFYAIDCTPKLLFELGQHYQGVAVDPNAMKGRITTACLKTFFRHCAGLLPWSQWAARSMIRDYGAEPERVHVLPPGIDNRRWRPTAVRSQRPERLQLLFVGADFERKGGPVLLDVFRRHLRDTCELHIVTKVDIGREPGVALHAGYAPDDPGLIELFQRADIVIVPTLADCFSMAAIEAMACAVPVITTPLGGIPEIVMEGETGFLVPPGDGPSLLDRIQRLAGDEGLRRRLGQNGRAAALRRFDAATQARLTIDVMVKAVERMASSVSPPPAHFRESELKQQRPQDSLPAPTRIGQD